jgi:hypothetical protein
MVHGGGTVSTLPLDQFGDFRLVRHLGEPGGFGSAYEALRGGERCVVKIFHGELVDQVALGRFQREVKAQRRASHPTLVEYLDSGVTLWQGRRCHWISMPYLEGRTLRDELLTAGGKLPPDRARALGREVALGLAVLHSEGIVHRDLKPSNIFICHDGRVVILDFGIALFLDYTSLTERGHFIGTWGYAAPEQLIGEEVPATDLYALGVVLYQLVTGRMPFTGRVPLELIHRIQFEDPEPPSSFSNDISIQLEQEILWLLEKEAHRRPSSADDVAELLGGGGSVVARKPGAYDRSDRPLLFLRAGRERDPLARACATACRPTAIVAPLTDKTARREGRQVAGFCNARFVADPQVFRMGQSSFTISKSLTALEFAPSDKITPYQPDHFRQIDAARALATEVVDAQVNASANLLFGASFMIRSLDDPWLTRSAKLLEECVRRRDYTASELPLFAPIVLSLESFCTPEAQSRLANRLSRANVDGYFVLLDQLAPESAPALLVAAIRLALVLQQTGRPVIIGRAGMLRHLVLPFGIAGVELGLGRYHGFSLSHFDTRRPFGAPAPRFEIPSLLASFSPDQAERILASGLVPESACTCDTCSAATTVRGRLERTIEHDAAMYELMRNEMNGVAPVTRVTQLEAAIAMAVEYQRALIKAKVLKGKLAHLGFWAQAVDAARPFLADAALRQRAA